jgi:hypothetical protein
MEVICSSETSVEFKQTLLQYIAVDGNFITIATRNSVPAERVFIFTASLGCNNWETLSTRDWVDHRAVLEVAMQIFCWELDPAERNILDSFEVNNWWARWTYPLLCFDLFHGTTLQIRHKIKYVCRSFKHFTTSDLTLSNRHLILSLIHRAVQ